MLCPNCHQLLNETEINTIDSQKAVVDECYTCGGHFFPSLLINFISENTAKNLDSIIPKTSLALNNSLRCPICAEPLINVRDEAVPTQASIFACPNNHGHFFPKGELISFKKAQKAKLSYHQIWGIPLKSAFAILLPIIFLFTAISFIPLTLEYLEDRQESRISAGSPISQPLITPIDSRQTIISFTTKAPVTTSIVLTTPKGQEKLPISQSPRTTHTINLENLQPNTTYTFNIIADETETKPYTFTTQP